MAVRFRRGHDSGISSGTERETMNNEQTYPASFRDLVLVQSVSKCGECERVFDLFDETDSDEWYYGHDCEA
jgi:hypothetical protein